MNWGKENGMWRMYDKIFQHYNYIKNKLEGDKEFPLTPTAILIIVNKKFHSTMFIFIGNLAFSDLMAGSAFITNIKASSKTMALLRTVTFVLGAFIICWLPAFTILLIDTSCTRKSFINPLIYTLRSKDMRKEFLRVLCCWEMMGQGKPAERCMIPLHSFSSLERCSPKQDLPTLSFMKEHSTFV
uniref:G-protein coupled receptors family 1 profile domain-containing protein n=1 Tax=Pseudonaja textilis TaxID=8673 RepID=A0A670XQB4_PSETE